MVEVGVKSCKILPLREAKLFQIILMISIGKVVWKGDFQKSRAQEATLHREPLDCLRNRADRPRINTAYPKY
jgi:hypothetical protein